MENVINIDGFCKEYRIDSNGKFGHYKTGHCAVCNGETTQVDATMLWDGIPTYLCSDVCYDKYWKDITCLTSQTKNESACIHAPCRDCSYNNNDGFFCSMEHYETASC